MDKANILILSVRPLEYCKVELEVTDGKKYISDLTIFKKVHCFPTDQDEWNKISITEGGYNITWSSRFEINVYQAVDYAISSETIRQQA